MSIDYNERRRIKYRTDPEYISAEVPFDGIKGVK
jgi:hypothetical protein